MLGGLPPDTSMPRYGRRAPRTSYRAGVVAAGKPLKSCILVALTPAHISRDRMRRFFAVIRRLATARPRLEFTVIVLQTPP